MAQVRLAAAPLTGGVSTQPPSNRFITQTTSNDNSLLAINRGLEKRYGSTFVVSGDTASGNLDYTGDPTNILEHWVKRNKEDAYCILIDKSQGDTSNVLQAFDSSGTKLTVTIKAGDEEAMSYLRAGDGVSRDDLRVYSSADTTFILNKTVVTALTGGVTDYVMADHRVDIASRDDTNPTSFLDPRRRPAHLNLHVNLVTTGVGYPVGIYKYILRGPDANSDNTEQITGPWYERVTTPVANSLIDATTMPVRLVYDPATSSLELSLCPWNSRMSGDDVTNPGPSFIGHTLNDITIFEDRMWLSGGQFVASSQADDIYNMWIDDWITVTDADPIDILLSGSMVTSGEFMVQFDRTLMLIADGSQQWELQTLASFTPSDTNRVPTTNYSVDKKAVPVKLGSQLYFMSDEGRYSHLWEYFPNFNRGSNVGENVSIHAEGYIPKNVRRLTTSETNNMVFLWSSDESNSLYVYTSSWSGTEKQQSSWARWVFDSDVTILGNSVINNDMYLTMTDGTNVWFEVLSLTPPQSTSDGSTPSTGWDLLTEGGDSLTTEASQGLALTEASLTGVGFHAAMDRQVIVTGTYSPTTKLTTWELPFKDGNMDTVLLGEQWGLKTGQVIASTTTTTGGVTSLTATGDFSTYPSLIGKRYSQLVTLSFPFVKDEQQSVIQGTFGIRTLDIMYEDSAFFEVDVTPKGRPTKTQRFLSNRFGSGVFGVQNIEPFGRFRVPVRGNASDTVITIRNSSPFPSLFTNMEFRGNFVRAKTNPTKR